MEYMNDSTLFSLCRVSPSAVLDFLWACLHKPVLWQGRVKKEAVENSNLSLVRVCVLPAFQPPHLIHM